MASKILALSYLLSYARKGNLYKEKKVQIVLFVRLYKKERPKQLTFRVNFYPSRSGNMRGFVTSHN